MTDLSDLETRVSALEAEVRELRQIILRGMRIRPPDGLRVLQEEAEKLRALENTLKKMNGDLK